MDVAGIVAIAFLPAVLAGIIQGVAGFGSAVVLMAFLPAAFGVTHATGTVSPVCLVLDFVIFWRYRRRARPALIVPASVGYLAVSSVVILLVKSVDQTSMKLALGVFLVGLSVYLLFFQGDGTFRPQGAVAVAFVAASGLTEGLFGFGGPLMALYYLARTASNEEYLGTIQGFFTINSVYITLFRAANGITTLGDAPVVALAVAGVIVGSAVAGRVVARLDRTAISRLAYAFIGMAGLVNAAAALV